MLIDKYREIFDTSSGWRYYNRLNILENPFDNYKEARNFIFNYFKTGNKENVLDTKLPVDRLRDIHSISAFFLGILLKPLCSISELKPDFRYLWFITCLYHDYGYYVESNKKKYSPKKYELTKIIRELDIKHDLLRLEFDSLFSVETIIEYYRYCQKEHSFINHGIIGGLLLYDKLMKNFEENKQRALLDDPELDVNDFIYNELHWSVSHEAYYKLAASSIISHNIWYAYNDIDIEKYKKNKLENLIIENSSQRIACKSNPFLFLLLLTDTIEPIKFFAKKEYKYVLENLSVETNNRQIIIIAKDTLCYQDWFNKIIDLKNWLQVTTKQCGNKLEINIE